MKRFIAVFLTIFTLASTARGQAPEGLSARSAVLMDAASGRLLYEKNGFERLPMASTTKIMTAILAVENCAMDDVVTVSPVASGVEGSSLWLEIGEKLTVEQLLYGLMLKSGNDAAVALAEHIAGSVDAFAAMMNRRASELGMYNTHFETPNGLDSENHYTTARDMAVMTRHAMTLPKFREIVGAKNASIPWQGKDWDRSLKNHNKLLWQYEGCTGVKTGYTKKSGRCLVSSALRDGRELIAVTLNAPDDWNDHTRMLDYGFTDFETAVLAEKGRLWDKITIDSEEVGLVCADGFAASLPLGYGGGVEYGVETADFSLPIKKGRKLARLYMFWEGELLGGVDLLADRDIAKKEGFFDKLIRIMKELM